MDNYIFNIFRSFGAAVIGYFDALWLVGGVGTSSRRDPVSTVFSYNAVRDEWERQPSLKMKRFFLAVALLGTKLYAIGGIHGEDGRTGNPVNLLLSAERGADN